MARTYPWVSGGVAAALALAATEVASGLIRGIPSLVVAVGDVIIDFAPFAVVESAISVFGTNDKTALVVGTVVVALLIGGWLGARSAEAPWVGPAGFAAFGVLGILAAARQTGASAVLVMIAAMLAVTVGVTTLGVLLREGQRTEGPGDERDPTDRRVFLGMAAGGLALAGLGGWGGRRLRQRLSVESARADIVLPRPVRSDAGIAAAALDVDGVTPLVTPNDRFYRIDTAILVPQVDPDDWTLTVTGHVDRPYELSYADLLDMPMVEEWVTLACVSNEVGDDLVGNAKWLGVPLQDVLERAGVRPEGTQIVGRSVDRFTVGFPSEAAFDGRVALVAVGMNGEPLPLTHGFPARLVVAGLYGYVSATKWLTEIELTRYEDFDAYWIPRGWAKEAPVKTQSRIDTPRNGRRVAPGTVPVAGVAWAPGRGISAVEVRVDDGDDDGDDDGEWRRAELSDDTPDETWCQWLYRWDAPPGEHTLRVRATDGEGDVQTPERQPPAPDGATGHHTIRVRVGD